MNAPTRPASFSPALFADAVDHAREIIAAHDASTIARGVRELIERPYLVRAIMRGVDTQTLARLTIADLTAYVTRRPTKPIGVRQLEAALRTPAFCVAFQAWRAEMAEAVR